MSRATALARGRTAAELGMADTCTITRITGRTTDPDTGEVTDTTSPLYTGKCRVQQHQATADRKDVGEDYLLLLRIEVQLPMSVTGLAVGDLITVTDSAQDADLIGRVFRIHDLAHKSEATARRVQCVERTGS
ncbi:MAG TPA: DUF6093 family protein [Nocardioidaceae bacterium]|nr:DUF6093 family protein [Nocardioidaceae bacterium]